VKIHRIIQKRIRHDRDGVQIAADVNAAVHVNVNEPRREQPRDRETDPTPQPEEPKPQDGDTGSR
jgi:hypothetical protein